MWIPIRIISSIQLQKQKKVQVTVDGITKKKKKDVVILMFKISLWKADLYFSTTSLLISANECYSSLDHSPNWHASLWAQLANWESARNLTGIKPNI